MGEPIENEYFNWLCAKVVSDPPVYFDLLLILHQTEFVWTVRGDRNRAADGCELREDFLKASRCHMDVHWFEQPCSILEVLIAFSFRASFQTDRPAKDWFWQFISNLDLVEYRQVDESDMPIIKEILNIFVWREYNADGHGGLFPMRRTRNDQTQVEIWYQFCEYLEDQGLI